MIYFSPSSSCPLGGGGAWGGGGPLAPGMTSKFALFEGSPRNTLLIRSGSFFGGGVLDRVPARSASPGVALALRLITGIGWKGKSPYLKPPRFDFPHGQRPISTSGVMVAHRATLILRDTPLIRAVNSVPS